MIATKNRRLNRLRNSFAVVVLIILVVDGATIFVRHNDAKPVSVHDAITKYRSHTGHTPRPAGSATPRTPAPATATPAPLPTASTSPYPPSGQAPESHPPVTTATSAPHQTATARSGHPPSPSTSPTASPSPLSLPPPGVYSYSTTGGEQVGVPGGDRSYPKTTTITVERTSCGVNEIWAPSTQHSETRQLCLHNGAVRLAGFSTSVSFFGVGSAEHYTCGSDATVYSPGMTLGHGTTFRCASADSSAVQTVTPIGFTHLTVGGTKVRTLHITVASALSGANQGSSTQQLWLTTDHSVLVRNTGRIDATQHGVSYHESYDLRLDDLTPKQ